MDRCTLLLAFMSLILQKHDKVIEQNTLNEINHFTAFNLSFHDIHRWEKKIKQIHPKLYHNFKKPKERSFGPNAKALINCLLNSFSDLDTREISKPDLSLIRKRSLTLTKLFI